MNWQNRLKMRKREELRHNDYFIIYTPENGVV